MAPIPIKRVVSVSSEDALQPGKNLLWPSGGKKWLCAAVNRSRRAEVEFELCKRARIAAIDVANFGSAFVEVKVGSSDSVPEEYVTLLPQSSLRSVAESKAGRNRTKFASYKREKLSTAAANQKWNKVMVVCRQPFHPTEQFGLQFIVFHSQISDHGSLSSHFLTPPQTPKLFLSPPPSHGHTPPFAPSQGHGSCEDSVKQIARLPNLPSNSLSKTTPTQSAKPKSQHRTPKRPLRERGNAEEDKGEEFEFTGVEKQSRLFQNALRGKTSGSKPDETNPILQKVISERKKYAQRDRDHSTTLESCYQRKKLLVKDLPKAAGQSDFASSYEKGASSTEGIVGAFNRIAQFDNNYEIGAEPEDEWGWARGRKNGGKRQKRGSPSCGAQWLTKRRKLDSMISECSKILNSASGEDGPGGEKNPDNTCSSALAPETSPVATVSQEHDSDGYDSDATDIYEPTNLAPEPQREIEGPYIRMVQCPICETLLYRGELEEHVGRCSVSSSGGSTLEMTECPLCGKQFPDYVIALHASSCGEELARNEQPGVIVID